MPPLSPDLSQRLTAIIETLRKMVAARGGRDRTVVPVVLLVWPYLHRLAMRFDSLTRKLRARKLRAGDPGARPTANRPASVTPRPPPSGPRTRLPTGYAWLIRLAPETAQLSMQVVNFVADPEISALLAEVPQAGRILRPLCRMLGILPSPDVPKALFPPRAPKRATIPEPAEPSPTPEFPTRPEPSPTRRAQRGRTMFRAAPA